MSNSSGSVSPFLSISLAFEVGFKLPILDSSLAIETRLCTDIEEMSVVSYVDSIIHISFV